MSTTTTTTLHLTTHELHALADALDAPGLWGVPVPPDAPEPTPGTDPLAGLVTRGLLEPDDGGALWPSVDLGALVEAVATHQVCVLVEQTATTAGPGPRTVHAVLAGGTGLVRHRLGGPVHTFVLDAGSADRLADTLVALVEPAPGDGRPGTRRFRGRFGALADLVPEPTGGWRRCSVLLRADGTDGRSRVDGLLAVLDAGPDRLWLVREYDGPELDEGGPAVVAEPATAAEVTAALHALAMHAEPGP
ncbi:hypothetical protein ABZ436_04735 [Micromonospora matsumotoense]|uniref:hypothetical protein n=1 Tax=Micromonospora matsumotoense TaxID=121616 RepID=UPI0033CEFCD0